MRRSIVAVTFVLAALAASAPSASAVTVGAPLNLPANTDRSCSVAFVVLPPPSCTFFSNDMGGAWTSQTPPGRWVISQARVRTGPSVGPMVFTVLRALRSKSGTQGIACCSSVAESQVFTPQPNAINTVTVNLPAVNTVELVDNEQIEVVDYLGITLLNTTSSAPVHLPTSANDPAATAMGSAFIPGLRLGQTMPGGALPNAIVLVNGEYQPAGSGPTPPTPIAGVDPLAVAQRVALLRRGTAARLAAVLNGPGVLRAGSPARARVARAAGPVQVRVAAKRKGKRRKLVANSRVRVRAAGEAKITVRLNRWGRKLLAKRGRLRLPVRVAFTPTGGETVTQTRKVTFKKRPAKRKKRAKR
ncbi:MAG: hypothetical protein GXY03_08970 [Solirubrobacterales bacterium]|nr:hypothetical protein [Solirubrobacterales bacterium]